MNNAKKVLVIGDSISCGYRRIISKIADGEFFVDGIGTSKAVDNPFFTKVVDYFLPQISSNIPVVLINNGLHGWNLSEDEYEKYYSDLIELLIKKLPKSKIVIVTTTPTRNSKNLNEYADNNSRVIERNNRAKIIANKFNLQICDLFAKIEKISEFYCDDGVHLTNVGYEILAEECYKVIKEIL